jgi:hypothetical protein
LFLKSQHRAEVKADILRGWPYPDQPSFAGAFARDGQAKLSAIKALNQVFMSLKFSALQPVDAATPGTAANVILALGVSYW